jgi:hypothetical protein
MKHLRLALVLLAFVAAGCEDENPNDPSDNPPAFSAALTTAAEVPPIADQTEAGASGTVTIRLNLTRDSSNAITSATADFDVTLSNFPAGSTINLAHIHEAPAGSSAGIAVNTGLSAGQVTLVNGAASFTRSGVPMDAAIAQRLLDNPAGFYFNVHSGRNPAGVVRGQLVRTN